MIRFLLAPLAAVLGAWAGRGLARRRPALPAPTAAAVIGFLCPPLVGAWFGRPFLEQALAVTGAYRLMAAHTLLDRGRAGVRGQHAEQLVHVLAPAQPTSPQLLNPAIDLRRLIEIGAFGLF